MATSFFLGYSHTSFTYILAGPLHERECPESNTHVWHRGQAWKRIWGQTPAAEKLCDRVVWEKA